MKRMQILYKAKEGGASIASELQNEALAMWRMGFVVGTEPYADVEGLLYRGPTMWSKSEFPKASRLLQGWKEYSSALFLSEYYPYLQDLTIPTFFTDNLDEETVNEIIRHGWEGAFIKNNVSAIIEGGQIKTLWPEYSMYDIKTLFNRLPNTGKFAIRKRIKMDVYSEERYWILNHHPYHHTGRIPEIVYRGVKRLRPLCNRCYVIDATPDIIIEVNPGESSDRYIENSPELFAEWFAIEFLEK